MKLAVFGPRDAQVSAASWVDRSKRPLYSNFTYVSEVLSSYDAKLIITGGGDGVERLALKYAVQHGIDHHVEPPLITVNGHDAFRIRNKQILEQCDAVALIWDGRDKFYHKLIQDALDLRKSLHIHWVE